MDSQLPDMTRPHEQPSPAQKRPYWKPTLTVLGSEHVEPAADPAALLRAYRAAVEREATAWRAVAMRLPDEPGFDRKAWDTWQRASLAEREARAKWEETASAASNQSNFAQLVWHRIR